MKIENTSYHSKCFPWDAVLKPSGDVTNFMASASGRQIDDTSSKTIKISPLNDKRNFVGEHDRMHVCLTSPDNVFFSQEQRTVKFVDNAKPMLLRKV